jgi:hypothetical protein
MRIPPILICALIAMPMLPALAAAQTVPERIFISGHSLVDQPLPSNLAAIAASLGTPVQWNRQYMVGSSMRQRARGAKAAPNASTWDGYRQGYNRDTENMDVLAELRAHRTVSGGAYDSLLITEQHGLLGSLIWNDTVRYLRHHHDSFIAGNAKGRTWFYESWFSLDDKNDPRRWIAYERAASPIWQCLVARVNLSLAAEGRPDRIEPLPAGVALAGLIERATQGSGVPGVTGTSARATVDRIVRDDVHLTALGAYYVSLVTYASMFQRAPLGAWAPAGVDGVTASALQTVAWELVQQERRDRRPLTLEECQAQLRRAFIATYWGYVRDAFWTAELGSLHAWARWAKYRVQWHWRLRAGASTNPLRYDSRTDRGYWFPAP